MSKLNRYTCDVCAQSILTEDVDEGTTPFSINCAATPDCDGVMRSAFYRVTPLLGSMVTHIWRKPTEAEYNAASMPMKEHFDLGGLALHKKEVNGHEQ